MSYPRPGVHSHPGRGPDEDALDERTRRARTERMSVRPVGGGLYEVTGESGDTYTVDVPGGRCTCPDHTYRRVWCKHLRRVAQSIAEGRVPPPGYATVACTACGDPTVVDERAEPPHYCDRCDLAPGDFAVDTERSDLVVVAERPRGRADETPVPGHGRTVADYPGNDAYPDDDPVVEVLYPLPAEIQGDDIEPRHLQRYRFPVSRLRPAGERRPRPRTGPPPRHPEPAPARDVTDARRLRPVARSRAPDSE